MLDRWRTQRAVERLVKALVWGDDGAAMELERMGWKPKTREEEACYLAAKHDWDGCAALGADGVEPLYRKLPYPETHAGASAALARIGAAAADRLTQRLMCADAETWSLLEPTLVAIGEPAAMAVADRAKDLALSIDRFERVSHLPGVSARDRAKNSDVLARQRAALDVAHRVLVRIGRPAEYAVALAQAVADIAGAGHHLSPTVDAVRLASSGEPGLEEAIGSAVARPAKSDEEPARPLAATPPTDPLLLDAGAPSQTYVHDCLTPAFTEATEGRDYRQIPEFATLLQHLQAGSYAAVCAEASKHVDQFRDFDTLYWWWGRGLIEAGELEEARRVLEAGVAASRAKWHLCDLRGQVGWKLGNLLDAVYWWCQAVHGQETLPRYGGEVGGYLHLHYVAATVGLPDCAALLLARSDLTRPGRIRLGQPAEASLRGLAHHSARPETAEVLRALCARYFGPSDQSESPGAAAEARRLAAVLADCGAGDEARKEAARRLGDVGGPEATVVLGKATWDMSLDVAKAAREALERARRE